MDIIQFQQPLVFYLKENNCCLEKKAVLSYLQKRLLVDLDSVTGKKKNLSETSKKGR